MFTENVGHMQMSYLHIFINKKREKSSDFTNSYYQTQVIAFKNLFISIDIMQKKNLYYFLLLMSYNSIWL